MINNTCIQYLTQTNINQSANLIGSRMSHDLTWLRVNLLEATQSYMCPKFSPLQEFMSGMCLCSYFRAPLDRESEGDVRGSCVNLSLFRICQAAFLFSSKRLCNLMILSHISELLTGNSTVIWSTRHSWKHPCCFWPFQSKAKSLLAPGQLFSLPTTCFSDH